MTHLCVSLKRPVLCGSCSSVSSASRAVSSRRLVPGDVRVLLPGMPTCDTVLLRGNPLVEESNLPGEVSLPWCLMPLLVKLVLYSKAKERLFAIWAALCSIPLCVYMRRSCAHLSECDSSADKVLSTSMCQPVYWLQLAQVQHTPSPDLLRAQVLCKASLKLTSFTI